YSLFSFKIKVIVSEIELVDFRFGGRFPRAWPNPPRRFAPAGYRPSRFSRRSRRLHYNQLLSK
ncbi:hypothetical protein SFC08_18390, partial [Lysinibacillus halotolerans]